MEDKNKIASLRSGTTNERVGAALDVVVDAAMNLQATDIAPHLADQAAETLAAAKAALLAEAAQMPADWAAHEARLEAACRTALIKFNLYADLHRAKGTPEGEEKAKANEELAAVMRWGLTGDDRPPLELTEDMVLREDRETEEVQLRCGNPSAVAYLAIMLAPLLALAVLIAALRLC